MVTVDMLIVSVTVCVFCQKCHHFCCLFLLYITYFDECQFFFAILGFDSVVCVFCFPCYVVCCMLCLSLVQPCHLLHMCIYYTYFDECRFFFAIFVFIRHQSHKFQFQLSILVKTFSLIRSIIILFSFFHFFYVVLEHGFSPP